MRRQQTTNNHPPLAAGTFEVRFDGHEEDWPAFRAALETMLEIVGTPRQFPRRDGRGILVYVRVRIPRG